MARELPIFDPNPAPRACERQGHLDRDGRRPARASPAAAGHAAPAASPGLDQVPDALGRQLPRPQGPAARAEPQHGLRGGALPEHRGVLGPAHRDGHDPRRRVHPGLRLLRHQDRQAHLVRRRRAAPRRRGGRRHAPRPRRGHERRPRRPARRRRRRLRRDDPRDPRPQPAHGRRGPDPGLQRRGAAAADRDGGRAGHPQPQPRDRAAPPEARPQARPLGPDARRCSSGRRSTPPEYGNEVAHQEQPHGRPRRDPRGDDGGLRGAARGRHRHPHDRPVPAADDSTTSRSSATTTPTSSRT